MGRNCPTANVQKPDGPDDEAEQGETRSLRGEHEELGSRADKTCP